MQILDWALHMKIGRNGMACCPFHDYVPRNISSISLLHFPRHHNKKGTDFSIPFFALADFFTNSIFLFVAKLRYLSEA